MKKILALLMALLMALSCFGALAEEAAAQPTLALPAMTITSETRVDEETLTALLPMLGMDESSAGMVQMLLPIVNNLTEQVVLAGNGAELDLLLGGAGLASIAAEQTEGGFILVSDLIPNYAITLSNETIENMLNQMTDQLSANFANVDLEQLLGKVAEYGAQYVQAAMSAVSFGDAEKGEFTFEGLEAAFNTKTEIKIDLEALKAAVETLLEQIKNDEAFAAVFEALGKSGMNVSFEVTTVTLPDELSCFYYSNTDDEGNQTDGTILVTVGMVAQGNTVNVDVLVIDQSVTVNVYLPEQAAAVQIGVAMGAEGLQCYMDMYNQDQFVVGFDALVKIGETIEMNADVYFMNPEKALLTETNVIAQGGERTLPVTAEGKTVIAVEEIVQDQEGQLLQALAGDLMSNGLSVLMARASAVMPEAVNSLMSLFLPAAKTPAE